MKKQQSSSRLRNLILIAAVLGILAIAFAFLTSMKTSAQASQRVSLPFTAFDKQKAMELLDTNADGKADCCESSLEDFVSQEDLIEIPLPNGQKMGPLDKTKKAYHAHADLNIYLDGKKIDLNQPRYFVKSAFIHVELDSKPGTGDVVHIHAPGVPLWWLLESLGITFTEDCLTMDTGESFCSQPLRLFALDEIDNLRNYVLQDQDRLLLTNARDEREVARQLSSRTSYTAYYEGNDV